MTDTSRSKGLWRRRTLNVASVPADHAYVRHLSPVTGHGSVHRFGDDAPGPVWRPSAVLTPRWLREHSDRCDVVHLHFGFEHRSAVELHELADTLDLLGLPLVLTVHDLDNPHLVDQRTHAEALDVLVTRAAAVLTLTAGAAAQIRRRWGVDAVVVPHPHVVPLERIARERPVHAGFVVGVQDKQRANTRPAGARAELAGAPGSTGITVLPPRRGWLTDEQLWEHVESLDALVLPYAYGTHSGFVEVCHDLGTHVIVPRTGYLAEQHDVVAYDPDRPGSLLAAVAEAQARGPAERADAGARAAQRDGLARVHEDLYVRLVAAVDHEGQRMSVSA